MLKDLSNFLSSSIFRGALYTIFLFSSAFGAQFPLLKRLEKAKSGDFIVLEANKTITLLVIRSINQEVLLLEEISAPSPKKRPESWGTWLQKRAPGHTSWSMVEIDLKNKQILECYSFTRFAWISQSLKDSFLSALIHLPLLPVSDDRLKRIGPAPQEGETDRRQLWRPSFFINGKKVEDSSFDVFEANWPQDGSELAGKEIFLYFDREARSPFPCWIQVDTGNISASLKAIDSGRNLPQSPFRALPRRSPEFIGSPIKTKKDGLRICIKSPKYYNDFELFAVDVTNQEKQIYPIAHSIVPGEGELLHLDIESEELQEMLTPHHKYTWLLMPTKHTSSYSELTKPYTWAP